MKRIRWKQVIPMSYPTEVIMRFFILIVYYIEDGNEYSIYFDEFDEVYWKARRSENSVLIWERGEVVE